MNTDCSKCGGKPDLLRVAICGHRYADGPAIITTYKCRDCGHWNNLKRRKGWSEKDAPKL